MLEGQGIFRRLLVLENDIPKSFPLSWNGTLDYVCILKLTILAEILPKSVIISWIRNIPHVYLSFVAFQDLISLTSSKRLHLQVLLAY